MKQTTIPNTGAVAAMLLVSGLVACQTAPRLEQPNFLVILCDDLGYGDLASYGHPTIKTPHLDNLAAEGIRFTNFYSAAPVCSASRAGLLTGRTPSRYGVFDWIPAGHPMHLKQDEITVATLLRSGGYQTAHMGKWHLNGQFNSPSQPQPDDHGFDYWFSTQNNAAPSHHNPENFVRNGEPVGPIEGYSAEIVVDEAVRWLIESRSAERPFFIHLNFHEPHEPIASPPDLVELYPGATARGQALYYANVSSMDRAVGKLMSALENLSLADNTVVLFTSDNGPETLDRYAAAWRSHGSPGHLRGMKLWLYEGGIRVPGIVRWPAQIEPGQVVDEPVSGLDLLPTLCELGGVLVPSGRVIDGSDVSPLFLKGADFRRDKPIIWHYANSLGNPKAALRTGPWALLAHRSIRTHARGFRLNEAEIGMIERAQLTDFELYNLRDDESQTVDLASRLPGKVRELSPVLEHTYEQIKDRAPRWRQPER